MKPNHVSRCSLKARPLGRIGPARPHRATRWDPALGCSAVEPEEQRVTKSGAREAGDSACAFARLTKALSPASRAPYPIWIRSWGYAALAHPRLNSVAAPRLVNATSAAVPSQHLVTHDHR